MRRNDGERWKTGVSDSGGANRRKFVVNQLLPEDDMRLVAGADFDDFMRHFVLEPKTYPRPVHEGLADRRVMHTPRDVALGRDALARSGTKLLEVAPWNVAAESRSKLCSTAHVHACIRWVTFAR